MTMTESTEQVRSADGATVAFERVGHGPPLILIDAAGHFRGFSSFGGLIELLAADFTVYHYDRRGRGESTDNAPYQVAREVEDLAALIEHAGGQAFVYGYSSGALLALNAAASGVAIPRMVLLEPPTGRDEDRLAQQTFTTELSELMSAGRRTAAVEYYLSGIGAPDDMIADMRGTSSWAAMESIAHTLVYDSMISEATTPLTLASVTTPTLVVDSRGSDDDLTGMAATVAAAIPDAQHRSLPGGWHGLPDETVAPVLAEFLRGGEPNHDQPGSA